MLGSTLASTHWCGVEAAETWVNVLVRFLEARSDDVDNPELDKLPPQSQLGTRQDADTGSVSTPIRMDNKLFLLPNSVLDQMAPHTVQNTSLRSFFRNLEQ